MKRNGYRVVFDLVLRRGRHFAGVQVAVATAHSQRKLLQDGVRYHSVVWVDRVDGPNVLDGKCESWTFLRGISLIPSELSG